ncbi:MAG: hypothetical protein KC425_05945, partial [Anaerolineales bacterium]|nr:hypothetical protein [Anaerolineales bacterium]
GRGVLLWLALPLAALLALYVTAARRGRAGLRSLWMELAGAAGLALTAPAAYMAATGALTPLAASLWLLLGTQNVLGALYVRLRIADTHGRAANRTAVLLAHAAGLGLIVGAGLGGAVPLGTAVPFAGFLLRAAWAARGPRPVPNVKRFGFVELAVEIVSGLWLVFVYRLV